MIKVTALSCLCADVFENGEFYAGGEAMNFACAICEYSHVEASVVAAVGDDGFGRKILSEIEKRPINSENVRIEKGKMTAHNMTYLTDAGDRYYKCDSWRGGAYQTFRLNCSDVEKLKSSDIVHINYYSTVFEEVCCLKKQGFFKLSADFNTERDFEKLERFAEITDFFFISAADGSENVLAKLCGWSKKFDGIFIGTLAEKGSAAFKNGKKYSVPAVPVNEVVDTTGCGDGYQAGFIGEFTKSGDIAEAMKEGSRVSSKILSHMGGIY